MTNNNDKLTGTWKLFSCMMEGVEMPAHKAVDELIVHNKAVAGW